MTTTEQALVLLDGLVASADLPFDDAVLLEEVAQKFPERIAQLDVLWRLQNRFEEPGDWTINLSIEQLLAHRWAKAHGYRFRWAIAASEPGLYVLDPADVVQAQHILGRAEYDEMSAEELFYIEASSAWQVVDSEAFEHRLLLSEP